MSTRASRGRIVFLINSLSGGGAERVTCNLANHIYKSGYIVDVITLSNKNDTYILDDGINRINLLDNSERASKLHNILLEWRRLKKYVLNNKNVLCYITMLPINSFLLSRLRKYIDGKLIISERVDPSSYSLIKKQMMLYAARRCDALVVQTEEIYRWYKSINNKKIIPNAINKDIIFPKRDKVVKKFVAVGRLSEQKNYPMIINAFKIFHEKNPDFILEIYGQGSCETVLKTMVNENNLNDKIRFMGYVKNISERISNATGFLMASNYEGMSNALIEAMCIGLPCVVTDCDGGSARSLINNMENGILIEKGSVEEMVSGMNKIVKNKEFSHKISCNAKKLRNRLDPEKIYDTWLEFIETEIE